MFKELLKDFAYFLLVLFFVVALPACGGSGSGNTDGSISADGGTVSDEDWDEAAVRRVLHTFAYGGFASDAQITTWADMPPEEAVVEIINFEISNELVSPTDSYDTISTTDGTLKGLSTYWSTSGSQNKISDSSQEKYDIDYWGLPERVWVQTVSKRGLNPVRQKIGLWETNYHLAVNMDAGINNRQMLRYYDDIMNSLDYGDAYQNVMALAGQSAAVATQYNHKKNVFEDARFEGNEDFAREYHQLFFGILGDYDPEYHEIYAIRNTAKALTDMEIERIEPEGESAYWSDEVTFGTEYHYPSGLDILDQIIDGPTAKEKIENLAQYSIEHEESLDNLPIIIVRGLADDNLDDSKIEQIQEMWQNLDEKNLLAFLRQYAISYTFHNTTRVKYWTSIDRNILISNLISVDNEETYLGYYNPESRINGEDVDLFYPTHNVFGGQTGLDASDSPFIFKEAYNRSTDGYWWYSKTTASEDNVVVWRKDWAKIMPTSDDGTYRVKDVGEWLWNRFIGDGLKNFGSLERAYVYALLGSGKDFGYFVNSNNPLNVYTKDQIDGDTTLQELMVDMEIALINIGNEDLDVRKTANYRVGLAISFITATPYMFAQEGL